jgi:hypothetical protein
MEGHSGAQDDAFNSILFPDGGSACGNAEPFDSRRRPFLVFKASVRFLSISLRHRRSQSLSIPAVMNFLTSSLVGAASRMEWLHVYIAGTAFLVCAFVAVILLLSFNKSKINSNNNIFTYLRFIYATFLKPHSRGGNGQQDALESFYKTQVCVLATAMLTIGLN